MHKLLKHNAHCGNGGVEVASDLGQDVSIHWHI